MDPVATTKRHRRHAHKQAKAVRIRADVIAARAALKRDLPVLFAHGSGHENGVAIGKLVERCRAIDTTCSEAINNIGACPFKYRGSKQLHDLEHDARDMKRRLFTVFVYDYNGLVTACKSGNASGWNPANAVFLAYARCNYLEAVCGTALRMLDDMGHLINCGNKIMMELSENGHIVSNTSGAETLDAAMSASLSASTGLDDSDGSPGRADSHVVEPSLSHAWAQLDRMDVAVDPITDQDFTARQTSAFDRHDRAAARHVSMTLPFFPLTRDQARSAFRLYSVTENGAVVKDYRPPLLRWRGELAPVLMKATALTESPLTPVGEYTLLQVMLQMKKLAKDWHFFSPDDNELRTLLRALLLRTNELMSLSFLDSEHALDTRNGYTEHKIWEGMTPAADGRQTTRQIVTEGDETRVEDADAIVNLKRQFETYGSTYKNVSVRFIGEIGGIFRDMYKDLLFYTIHVEPRCQPPSVYKTELRMGMHVMLMDLIPRQAGDAAMTTGRRRRRRREQRERSAGLRGDDDPVQPRLVPEGHLQMFVNLVREHVRTETTDIRDKSFIDAVIRRIVLDQVPYGTRERYASANGLVMSSTMAAQDQEFTPPEIMAQTRTFYREVGLPHFTLEHVSFRVRARTVAMVFQRMLYRMNADYVWNAKEKANAGPYHCFGSVVSFGGSREFETNTTTVTLLESIPRVLVLMNGFFIYLEGTFFRITTEHMYTCIAYWIIMFYVHNNFKRQLGHSCFDWVVLRQWIVNEVLLPNRTHFLNGL